MSLQHPAREKTVIRTPSSPKRSTPPLRNALEMVAPPSRDPTRCHMPRVRAPVHHGRDSGGPTEEEKAIPMSRIHGRLQA